MTIGKTRNKLMALSGDAFANEIEALMGVLSERVAQSRRLGLLDRQGVDVFVFREADHSVEIAIQCKGYERPFESDQVPALLDEVGKFARKGPDVEEYWLTINRPITGRSDRDKVEAVLSELERSGKCRSARLLDLDQLTQFLLEQAQERIVGWVNAFRERSIADFRESMGIVDYISGVPFERDKRLGTDPSQHVLAELREFQEGVDPSNTGPYRISPRFLLTASFGFGKTSTLQEIAKDWIESDGVALYLPAALLAEDAWDRDEPEARLDRLYDRFFRTKLLHDRYSAGAGGRVVRAGTVFKRFGEEEGAERLLRAMTMMAVDLFEQSDWAEDTAILEFDEEFMRRQIASQVGNIEEVEEITLNSLIMPIGRRNAAGHRLYRFAHKSYQDWLIARGLVTQDTLEMQILPESVAYFVSVMRAD